MSHRRPSWLTEPCPSWCHVDHADQDHVDDRYHQSKQVLIPVVIPQRVADGDAGSRAVCAPAASEVAVLALQPVGDCSQTWVAVVGERQFIEVTLESATRLHTALGEVLSDVS